MTFEIHPLGLLHLRCSLENCKRDAEFLIVTMFEDGTRKEARRCRHHAEPWARARKLKLPL